MIAFFPEKYTVKDHISNTKLEKGDHYYMKTRHELNINEEITPNRQNHSFLLPNRIYLPSIKSNGYNTMDFEKQSGKR